MFKDAGTAVYDKLSQDLESEGASQTTDSPSSDYASRPRKSSFWPNVLTHVATALVTLIITLAVSWSWRSPSLETCSKQLSTWSPALEAVRIKAPKHFEAEIVQTNKWRGLPGADPTAFDEAWLDIGLRPPLQKLDENDLRRLGKDVSPPDKPMHVVPDELGGGYPGMLEAFHLLHCLDSLRQATFYNWDHYKNRLRPGDKDALKSTLAHHDHCIDILRMNLMCQADVTPLTFWDSDFRAMVMPDFETLHTCRDFDAVLEWAHSNPRAAYTNNAIGDSPRFNKSAEANTGGGHGH